MTTLIPKYDQGSTGAINRPFNLKLEETISVKDFGAVGNGVVDDTTAMNAAFSSGASNIYFPAGTYNVSSSLTIPPNTSVYGDGSKVTILKYIGTSGTDFINFTINKDYPTRSPNTFSDIQINGNSLANNGLVLFRVSYVTINRVWVQNCLKNGIYIQGDGTTSTYAYTLGSYYNSINDSIVSGNNKYGVSFDTTGSGARCNANVLNNVTSQGNLVGGYFFGAASYNNLIGGTSEVNGIDTGGSYANLPTSATSLTIAALASPSTITVNITFTAQTFPDSSFFTYLPCRIINYSSPGVPDYNNYMSGLATAYTATSSTSGTLTVQIDNAVVNGVNPPLTTFTGTSWYVVIGVGIYFSSSSEYNTVVGMDLEQNPPKIANNLTFYGNCNRVLGGSVGDTTSVIYGGISKNYTSICNAYSGSALGRQDGIISLGQVPASTSENSITLAPNVGLWWNNAKNAYWDGSTFQLVGPINLGSGTFRFANVTTTQKNTIASPTAGMVVFDTTLSKLCVYSGSAWQTITST